MENLNRYRVYFGNTSYEEYITLSAENVKDAAIKFFDIMAGLSIIDSLGTTQKLSSDRINVVEIDKMRCYSRMEFMECGCFAEDFSSNKVWDIEFIAIPGRPLTDGFKATQSGLIDPTR